MGVVAVGVASLLVVDSELDTILELLVGVSVGVA